MKEVRRFRSYVWLFMSVIPIDPFFQASPFELQHIAQQIAPVTAKAEAGSRVVSSFIRSADPDLTAEAVHNMGGVVRLQLETLLSVEFPKGALLELAERDEVLYLEAAKPIGVTNNLAGRDINLNEAHVGVQLPQEVTGKGVIIGVIDTGIDLSHPDFLDLQGKSRVLAVWDQVNPRGPSPTELAHSYGTECDQASIQQGTCAADDPKGHGTHIAGTAAGRHPTYGGVAPDANLIVVRYQSEIGLANGYANPLFSTTICEAAYYVFQKAKKLNMPAVVNLSLGTHIGPHDGTSLFEECLDYLVAEPGFAIVASAGNERIEDPIYTGLHVAAEVKGEVGSNFVIRAPAPSHFYYIDLWGGVGSNVSVGLALHRGSPSANSLLEVSEWVSPGKMRSGTMLNGLVSYQINAFERSNPQNGKPHVGVSLFLDPQFFSKERGDEKMSFDLLLKGKGRIDAWLYPDKPATTINFTHTEGERGQSWKYIAGDRSMSIAMPGTAAKVISVGGYATRNRWGEGSECCQVDYQLGNLLSFSSVGPAADRDRVGVKPELVAPGGMIASARSSTSVVSQQMLVDQTGEHVMLSGTSMAAPFVTGAAALIFSINPHFTAEEIEELLVKSAYVDGMVGEVPNDAWGYGKLDVLRAVELATQAIPQGNLIGTGVRTSEILAPRGGCAFIPF